MVFCPEHPKRDQNLKCTFLDEMTSILAPFIWEFSPHPPPPARNSSLRLSLLWLAKHKPSRLGQEEKCGLSSIVKLSGITSRGSLTILGSNRIIAKNIPTNYDSDVRPDVLTTF